MLTAVYEDSPFHITEIPGMTGKP